jgi:hypothetical protein
MFFNKGFHFAGFRYHPYTIKLGELIRNHCEWVYGGSPDRPQIDVSNKKKQLSSHSHKLFYLR